MSRVWIAIGALYGLGAVAMAAVAAHALSRLGPAAVHMVESANQMLGWHAPALIGAGLWAPRGGRLAHAAGAAFALGTALFCGAVYSHALAGVSLGSVAPIGGSLTMIGWALLALSALVSR